MLIVFAGLAVVHLLPTGISRAVVAAPVLLIVPGSLTLGAAFKRRRLPQATTFVCYAALLSVVWSAFASLILYVLKVPITAESTYWCLLAVSTPLALVAEVRLVLGHAGGSHRTAIEPELLDPGLSADPGTDLVDKSIPFRAANFYGLLAAVAGASILVGGLYVYEHHPQPAPVGYTWIAWTRPKIEGNVSVGPTGTELDFQIFHRESDTTTFRLSAAWLGSPSRPLAKPLTLSIGPNQTFRGTLFVPPLPNGCTYRIVVALNATRQIDPLTKKLESWSINANVYAPGKSLKACKS